MTSLNPSGPDCGTGGLRLCRRQFRPRRPGQSSRRCRSRRRRFPRREPSSSLEDYRLKALSLIVAPQRDCRRRPMGEGEIHPAIVVEIENGDCQRWARLRQRATASRSRNLPSRGFSKTAGVVPSRSGQDRWHDHCCSRYQPRSRPARSPQDRSLGNIGEGSVAVVAPHVALPSG